MACLLTDALQTDASDEAKVQALVAGAVKWGGSVDLYVNNAWKFAFGNVNSVSNSGMPTMVTSHPAPEALCTPALCYWCSVQHLKLLVIVILGHASTAMKLTSLGL